MRKRASPFKVTRNGFPIEQHVIKNPVDARIQYAERFGEFSACIAAGLNIERWEAFGYTPELKASVVAWYELSNEIALHQQDAKNRKEERMMKRKR